MNNAASNEMSLVDYNVKKTLLEVSSTPAIGVLMSHIVLIDRAKACTARRVAGSVIFLSWRADSARACGQVEAKDTLDFLLKDLAERSDRRVGRQLFSRLTLGHIA